MMATFLLQAAGSAIGTALGGPIGGMLGRMVGAVAGSVIDRALLGGSGGAVEGPRLKNLDGISSTEGAPIPRVYGRARLGGQVIWATKFEEVISKRKVASRGGKGSPAPKTTETVYSYYANVAIALCEGPIAYVRQVWADGKPLDLATIAMRAYHGDETQTPDPLIVAKEGAAAVPAYRGTAYVVFERLPLADFGNRLPQLTFEVVCRVPGLNEKIRAVALIPGSGEFAYETVAVTRSFGYGSTQPENRHQFTHPTDWAASLDQLQALCPNLTSVSLVVSWYGDDLRVGQCTVAPRVDIVDKATLGGNWLVAGLTRPVARLVTQIDGRGAYGGTPSDASVLHAIQDLKARGLKVVFNPFVMMDIGPANSLTDPWTGSGAQPAFPWRGRITCHPAPGQSGSPDGTSTAAAQVNAFFGAANPSHFSLAGGAVVYAGPDEWSLRRQVLHYAMLCVLAGGVDAFLIGSELVGLTRVRSAAGAYPAASALVALAADVRSILGSGTKISYGADWTEYGSHVVGNEVNFPLDPLWASSNVDFIGIDWYPPLSDWRDGRAHADAQIADTAIDVDYLLGRVNSGEAYDWYYASNANRSAQLRSPITDGLGKAWVFRQKDLANWWLNQHRERLNGVEKPPTAWVPGSKPIWLTEIGCPAVDRAGNAPNVFPDPKSASMQVPYFSRGARDDLAQSRVLSASLIYFDPAWSGHPASANPVSPTTGIRMVDPARIHVWAWDARPFPAFPHLLDVWSDGPNWANGHWLNGRLEGASVDDLIVAIARDFAGIPVQCRNLSGYVDGYVVDRTMSARDALDPLLLLFSIDGVAAGDGIRFQRRDRAIARSLGVDDLVPGQDDQLLALTRSQETELPREVSVTFIDSENDFRSATVASRRIEGSSTRQSRNEIAIASRRGAVQALSDIVLQEAWIGRETVSATLRPGLIDIEIGDTIALDVNGRSRLFRISRLTDGVARKIEAKAVEPALFDVTSGQSSLRKVQRPVVAGPPLAVVVDLPMAADDATAMQYLALAADPWPTGFTIWRSLDGASFEALSGVVAPSIIGQTLTALAPGPIWRWDRANTLDIALSDDSLASTDPQRVLSGENLLAIRGSDGAWELLGFADATLIGVHKFRLRTLLRGLGASEPCAARPAPAGSTVVLVDHSLTPLVPSADGVGRPYHYRVSPAGADIGHPSTIAFDATATAIVLKPYAPVRPRARNGAGGITISWIRRTRMGGDPLELNDVPLSEDREAYEVEIMAGATVKRLLSATSTSVLYASADIASDFPGGAPASLSLRIYQLSATIGRGMALVETVPIT